MHSRRPPAPPHAIEAGASILNLAATLAGRFGAPAGAAELAERRVAEAVAAARSIVLIVLDGFGERQLQDHVPAGTLAACRLATLSSVFPSATAPAMTSFATALAPAAHGNPGWLVWSDAHDCVVRSLPLDRRGDPAAAVSAASLWSWQAWAAASSVPSFAWLPAELAESRFSAYAYGSSTRIGYERPEDIIGPLADAAKAAPAGLFALLYLPRFDSFSHQFGCRSPQAARVAQDFDRWFERLVHRLRELDVLLLVTADHGFIDVEPEHQFHLADHPRLAACLRRPLSGEPRVPFCELQPGCENVFAERVAEAFGESFALYESRDLLQAGWFGTAANTDALQGRIGTHMLLPRAPVTLVDRLEGEPPPSFIGMHGGPSDDEMRVPLIAAYRGRALV